MRRSKEAPLEKVKVRVDVFGKTLAIHPDQAFDEQAGRWNTDLDDKGHSLTHIPTGMRIASARSATARAKAL